MTPPLTVLVMLVLSGAFASAVDDPPWTAVPRAPIDEAGARTTIATWYRLAAADLLPRPSELHLSGDPCEALAVPEGIAIRKSSTDEFWLITGERIARLYEAPAAGSAPDAAQLAAATAVTRGFLPMAPPLDPSALEVEMDGSRGWRMRLRGAGDAIFIGAEDTVRGYVSCCACRGALRAGPKPPRGSG